ncbi:MAG: AmmeMemoRadiSam system radical SAM enzyme [Candidatus Omnitrophica bacterium]|jgi:pyruvate formate lyase activating enzyme|nr:AmmeMemoRadiSam system radical SAM enzyme [Candidatus Omnitrophota bacterium]
MKPIRLFLLLNTVLILAQAAPCGAGIFSEQARDTDRRQEALYYNKLDNGSILCALCPRGCVINEGKRGFCRVRQNTGGTLYSLVYARPCAVHVDPIEKKPLFHVLPGAKSFSIATAGCNLSCGFCQNWHISQVSPEDIRSDYIEPAEIVRLAISSNAPVIAYTYTEPTVFYEYMLNTAMIAKEAGILNVMHSSGFINEAPLRRLCKYLDAANIDLKGSEKFYLDLCQGRREDVLRSLKILREEGVWVEITYLLIPTLNDSDEYIKQTCRWIKENLGVDTPLHISRFWPMHKIRNLPPTPMESLYKAYDIARAAGLRYVYIGNVLGVSEQSTFCPFCRGLLIQRSGYDIAGNNIVDGKCKFCKNVIAGLWQSGPKGGKKGEASAL